MDVEFRRPGEVDPAELLALWRDPLVRRLMPLPDGELDEADCVAFLAAKERMWAEHGYGPWAFYRAGRFAGWGGPQPAGDDVRMSLVLGPDHWDLGPCIYEELMRRAFDDHRLPEVTVLFPRQPQRLKAFERLGFRSVGLVRVGGIRFERCRIAAPERGT